MVTEASQRGINREAAALFVAGTTATPRALIDIKATLDDAYDGDVTVIGSSLLTGPPNAAKYDVIADVLEDSSGKRLDSFAHSSGVEEFRRGLAVQKRRDPGGRIDMSSMNLLPVEPIQGVKNLRRGMPVYLGRESRAIDSMTAFPIDGMDDSSAIEVKRLVFPHLVQDGEGLTTVRNSTQKDYARLLNEEERAELHSQDMLILQSLGQKEIDIARELLIQRGEQLKPHIETIYRGQQHPPMGRSEVRKGWTPKSIVQAAGVASGTVRGRSWGMLYDMRDREDGPTVQIVVPEFGPIVSVADTVAFYGSKDHAEANVIFMPGYTHSGLALQPGVLKKY